MVVSGENLETEHPVRGAPGCHGPPLRVARQMAESKGRIKGMKSMLKEKVGFSYIENFLKNSASMGRSSTEQGKEEGEVLKVIMENILRDERRHLANL